jgi:hypothetical protein
MAKNKINSGVDEKILQCVSNILEVTKVDIYVVTGELSKPIDENAINSIKVNKSKPNAFLLLNTYGGDPDAAFRLAKIYYINAPKKEETEQEVESKKEGEDNEK